MSEGCRQANLGRLVDGFCDLYAFANGALGDSKIGVVIKAPQVAAADYLHDLRDAQVGLIDHHPTNCLAPQIMKSNAIQTCSFSQTPESRAH